MKLLFKRIQIGLFVVLTTLFLASCDFAERVDKINTAARIKAISPADGTVLKAGEVYNFELESDAEDKIRISYYDEEKEVEYEYIYKDSATGKFARRVRISTQAVEVRVRTTDEDGEYVTRQRYEVKGAKKYGTINKPTSYDKANKCRTNTPEAVVIDDWLKDSALESTRTADPLKYIEDVSAKINEATEAISDETEKTFMKLKLVHDLIACSIKYDVEGSKQSPMPPNDYWTVIRDKKGVCQGYALCFNKFCEVLEIPCEYVFGWGKSGVTHAWDLVKVNNESYLVDCTWDAGYGVNVKDENNNSKTEFKFDYSTGYLFLNPELFIWSHIPEESKYQLTNITLTTDSFLAYPTLEARFFEVIDNAESSPLLRLTGPAASSDGTYSLTYKMKNNNQKLLVSVSKKSTAVYNAHVIEYGETQNTVKFSFPEEGEYTVSMTLLNNGETSGASLGSFKINATKASTAKYVRLYQPLSAVTLTDLTLKKGQSYQFKGQLAKDVEKAFVRFYYTTKDETTGKDKDIYVTDYVKDLTVENARLITDDFTVPTKMGTRDVTKVRIYVTTKDADGNTKDISTAVYDVTE